MKDTQKEKYLKLIENEIVDCEISKKAKDFSMNKIELFSKLNIGKYLSEADMRYGRSIVKDFSDRLTKKYGSGYSKRNLWLMIKYYNFNKKVDIVSFQLSWSHYCELISLNNINEIKFYIKLCEKNNLTVRELRKKIKFDEYGRLEKKVRNELSDNKYSSILEIVKNPILINSNLDENYLISERVLQKLILEDIPSFLKELGQGFSFIDNEYKFKLGNTYNYIDLLLYNIVYNCYVVIELKVRELKKQDIGQIQVYMNYVDDNIKTINQDKTIGIIICKENNELIIKYSSDPRIISREYKLVK